MSAAGLEATPMTSPRVDTCGLWIGLNVTSSGFRVILFKGPAVIGCVVLSVLGSLLI